MNGRQTRRSWPHLAIHLQDQSQNAVSGRMLRSKVELHVLDKLLRRILGEIGHGDADIIRRIHDEPTGLSRILRNEHHARFAFHAVLTIRIPMLRIHHGTLAQRPATNRTLGLDFRDFDDKNACLMGITGEATNLAQFEFQIRAPKSRPLVAAILNREWNHQRRKRGWALVQ